MGGWRPDNAWLATAGATQLNTCTVTEWYPTEGCQFGGRYVIKGTSRVRYETLWNVIYVISAVFEVLAVCIFKAVQDEKNAYSMLSPNRR